LKIAVISANKTHLDAIQLVLMGEGALTRTVMLLNGGIEHLGPVADQKKPDLFILDGLCRGPDDLAAVEQAGMRHPGMAFIVLSETQTPELLLKAMQIGVRDVLPSPASAEALLAAVERIERKAAAGATPARKGKILAFLPCKGGSGSTFLAANLGYTLAAGLDKKVALLDLNLQFGDASLFISDHVPANTLADVARNIARLDASFLASSMVDVLPNFGVLAAPEDPEHAAEVRPEHIDVLLDLARAHYDHVILDIGRNLTAATVKALDHADVIFPVLQETLPFIRDAKRLIHALYGLGYARDKIHLIINRYEKGGDIRLEDVERALEMKVFSTIPNSFEAVSKSVNQGVPIMKIARHDPVTKALRELAQDLVEGGDAKKGGWLAHLLHPA
jgi:pilus assembly protein CpaE